MIKLVAISITAISLTGCVNMAKVVEAAGKDPANVHFQITTIYGTLTYDRANSGTNTISVGPTGITTK